jgi:hypothetical protein
MSLCAGALNRKARAVYRKTNAFFANSRQRLCVPTRFDSITVFDKLRNAHEHW